VPVVELSLASEPDSEPDVVASLVEVDCVLALDVPFVVLTEVLELLTSGPVESALSPASSEPPPDPHAAATA
jgi:hypothetical protein